MREAAIVGILGCLSIRSMLLAGEEQKLKPSEVPTAVTAAATKRFPKARLSGWSKEVEKGKTTYEASVRDGALKHEVVLSEGGSILAVEDAISVSSLPASVTSAVRAKYPKAAIIKAEKITRSEEIQYEVDLRNSAKKELVLTSDGQIVQEE